MNADHGAIEIKLPDLSRVALEEGDAILLRVHKHFSMADLQHIESRIKLKLPGHEVLIVSGDIELAILRPVRLDPNPRILPPSTVHVPDAAGLRGRIMVMVNQATSEPGRRMSLPMVALGNEIWHTVVAHLAEHGVELGLPREVEQSVRWKQEQR